MDNVILTNAAERSAAIKIGDKEYELVLTTRATKAIAGRYGGLENLGEKLMKSENFEMALDEIVWLITLLAKSVNPDSQPLRIRTLRRNFSLRRKSNFSLHRLTWQRIKTQSPKRCSKAQSAMLKARKIAPPGVPHQKTWKSGRRTASDS